MDIVVGAAPMVAEAKVVEAVVIVKSIAFESKVAVVTVAPTLCPSIGGTSLSAVSPDYMTSRKELALGVA